VIYRCFALKACTGAFQKLLIITDFVNVMDQLREKFARFKSGVWGRTVDITLGIVLLLFGFWLVGAVRYVVWFFGVFALTAGLFNVCWLAPVIGIPFSGKTKLR